MRSPYTRLLAAYPYAFDIHRQQYGDCSGFIIALPEILTHDHEHKGSNYLPQTAYTYIDGAQVCAYIRKFEEFPLSIEPVRARLKLQTTLEQHNTHRSIDWSKRPVASYLQARDG